MICLRRTVTKCAHTSARTVLLLAVAVWASSLWAFAAPTAVTPAPTEKPAATPAPADLENLSLLDAGRELAQVGLPDLAWPIYQAALKRTTDPQMSHLRLRASCEAAIFLFKTERTAEAAALVAPLRDTLTRGEDPDTRCLRNLALGYAALAEGKLNEADDAQLEAMREVKTKSIAVRQGDCYLLQAASQLARKKYPEAAETARTAVRAYTTAALPLSVAEAQHFVARVLTESGDAAGSGQAETQALGAVTSLTQGPCLDPSRTASQLAESVAGHRTAADQKRYKEARNGVLSLLILAHNRTRFADRPEIAASEDLNDHVLLGYLAVYTRQQSQNVLAGEFLSLGETGLDKEPSKRAQGEFEWLAARYERGAGNPDKVLQRLDQADADLLNLPGVPGYLAVGVAEERALALATKQDGPGATKSLQTAIAAAKAASLAADQTRLEGYAAEVARGNLSIGPGAVAVAVPLEAARQAQRTALLTQDKVTVFRSPFVADYPAGAATSALDALATISLPRPTPLPPTGNLITPEERIRLGLMHSRDSGDIVDTEQFRKAIPDLLQILARDGDSVIRLDQLGQCYSALGKWADAADAYQRLLKLDPANVPAKDRLRDITAHLQEKKTE